MKPRILGLALLGLGVAACVSDTPPKDPNERSASDLYVLKAVQYMEGGKLDIAKQDLQRAIDLDAKNFEAHNAMGVLYERLDQLAEAEAEFKEAMALKPDNPDVAINYGRVLCAEGKSDQAMKLFTPVLDDKLYPSPWLVMTNIGVCLKRQGQVQEAEGRLRQALEANPGFAPALLEMAKLSLENGNAFSARAFLERFEGAAPPTPESLWFGFQTEKALGNGKEASLYLKRLRRFFPESNEARRSHQDRVAP